MLRFLYTLIFIIALPVVFYRLWIKDKKVPGYKIRWPERFGIYTETPQQRPVVWVHAVSVGEVVAATPIIRRLLDHGGVSVMVTTMTPTGSTRVTNTFGKQVLHVYAPYDLPWTVAAFLRRTRPILSIIMETELWPNMLHECARQQLPIILANARLSERSAKRYARFAKTTRALLECLSHVAVQNAEDGQRFLDLGLAANKLRVIGSVKFDITLSPEIRAAATALRQTYGADRPVVIAASTHEGEDEIVLDAFANLLRRQQTALLILVPRHPERFDTVYSLSSARFNTCRRSSGTCPEHTEVIVGDTMGEMILLYGCADVAFVGGSLIERGGHNIIEPACWGLPILCGPHTFNFADISKRLEQCGGMKTVHDAATLARQLDSWFERPEERLRVGAKALEFTEQNRGAVDRLMEVVDPYLPHPINNSPNC
ncbi:3-deoxy-D-manno-octulosonic acid transferase [Saccharophagus sp. K07]|uniref:lipid IV(A) 3-deoxy-D-manno-octulosonic acid transferase n=1 Tax=Saccharophagus sp. K07 TaxID=2283636 RepID=UPI001651E2FB|nr:lipid IV(A) 3-deoxy-D-manno-octulosonic acid transferase [Saccharophagus sp. K07]MBC6906419.1 3-deoxy-D-manno-octulosonic acid transferase [Saccharophagus sp. K07]